MTSVTSTYENPPDRDRGATVLIVDDELGARTNLESVCRELDPNIRILQAETIPEALAILSSTMVHVVLLDKNLGPIDRSPSGIEAIPEMLTLHLHLQILMVTGSTKLDDVVRAMQLGACDYAIKGSCDELIAAQVKRALKMAELTLESARAENPNPGDESYEFLGKSPAIRNIFQQSRAFAQSNLPVLLTGESGTGKTITAKMIHDHRKAYLRQDERPFIRVILGNLTPTLIESELFGHEQGAFTDAKKAKAGRVELANYGTLFLDEIADIPLSVQVKLLRVLDDGTYERVGGTKELKTSFKLICATNKNLEEMVKAGTFREDLYFRICTFMLRIPSLSERREDIPDIIRALLPKCCKLNGVFITFEDLPNELIEYLTDNLPLGNLRGLQDQLARLLTLAPKDKQGVPQLRNWKQILEGCTYKSVPHRSSRSALTLQDLLTLPLDVTSSDFPGIGAVTSAIERRILIEAKKHFDGKNRKIAKFLKLSESATSTRLKMLEANKVGAQSPIEESPRLSGAV